MIVKPNDRATIVLARLGKSSDWDELHAWLLDCREDCITGSLIESEAKSRQQQGALMAIDALIRNIQTAVELSTGG